MKVRNISIVGLGKLGLCMAAVFADNGYNVYGVDLDEVKIDRVNKGDCPVNETRLAALVKENKKRLLATYDYNFAICNSDVTFIVVATPSQEDGNFSNAQLEAAIIELSRALKLKKDYHLIAVTSTVTPKTMDTIVKPLLEKISGKRCGRDFGLAYNPEFIALGSVIYDFTHPDFILIGESDKKTGDILSVIYKKICKNNPKITRMSLVNAEIAKISLNCYVTMKISFANTLAEVCEKVNSANVDTITDAIGIDRRIGRKYLTAGLGFGGPCFPRDNVAFVTFAKSLGLKVNLPAAVHNVNIHQAERIVRLADKVKKCSKVCILGLSYKPHTEIVEESQSIDIALAFKRLGACVWVYDPMAMNLAKSIFGKNFEYARDLNQAVKNSDICVVTLPWDEFKLITPKQFELLMKKNGLLIDCWRLYDSKKFRKVKYKAIGVG